MKPIRRTESGSRDICLCSNNVPLQLPIVGAQVIFVKSPPIKAKIIMPGLHDLINENNNVSTNVAIMDLCANQHLICCNYLQWDNRKNFIQRHFERVISTLLKKIPDHVV